MKYLLSAALGLPLKSAEEERGQHSAFEPRGSRKGMIFVLASKGASAPAFWVLSYS